MTPQQISYIKEVKSYIEPWIPDCKIRLEKCESLFHKRRQGHLWQKIINHPEWQWIDKHITFNHLVDEAEIEEKYGTELKEFEKLAGELNESVHH